MRLTKLVLGVSAAAALLMTALPSQAAAPKTAPLYFGNAAPNGTGTCTPQYVLSAKPIGGDICGTLTAGVNGNGLLGSDEYSSEKKAVGFKIDGKRHVTGTVFVASYGPIAVGPLQTLPGPQGATVTVSINGKEIGSTKVDAVNTDPAGGASVPIDFAVPSTLNGKVVTSVIATVDYRSGTYITTVRYDDAHQSKLNIPKK